MTITYDSLAPLVALEAPNCPDSIIKVGLKRAAEDFYTESELWRVECDVSSVTGEASVDLELPSNTALVAPYQVYVNGREVGPTTPTLVADPLENWMTKTGDTVLGYWINGPTSLRLWPIPTVAAAVTAHVAVAPTLECTEVPDVATSYQQTLIHGALWKLQSMDGQAWSNPEGAAKHRAEFLVGIGKAAIFAKRSGSGSLSVAMRSF